MCKRSADAHLPEGSSKGCAEGGSMEGGLCKGGACRAHLLARSRTLPARGVQQGGVAHNLLESASTPHAAEQHTGRRGAGEVQYIGKAHALCTHIRRGVVRSVHLLASDVRVQASNMQMLLCNVQYVYTMSNAYAYVGRE